MTHFCRIDDEITARYRAFHRSDVGTWTERCAEDTLHPHYTVIALKDDLSYVGEERRRGQRIARSAGFWSVNGKRLYRECVTIAPISADARAEDCDQIASCDGQTLVLISEHDGVRRVFERIP